MNLEELSRQYRGAKLPQLIEKQIKSLDEPTLLKAIQGTWANFSPELGPQIDSYTMNYVKNWFGPHVVTADLGELFDEAVKDIKNMAAERGVSLSDERVFDIFNLMVMRLSYFAHTKPDFRKMLGVKKGWFS